MCKDFGLVMRLAPPTMPGPDGLPYQAWNATRLIASQVLANCRGEPRLLTPGLRLEAKVNQESIGAFKNSVESGNTC